MDYAASITEHRLSNKTAFLWAHLGQKRYRLFFARILPDQRDRYRRVENLSCQLAPLSGWDGATASNGRGTPMTGFYRAYYSSLPRIPEGLSDERARCRVRTCDFLRVKQALYH